jgi:hypothetical protein
MIPTRKSAIYQAYFGLATLEGGAALYFSVVTKSMERNVWLLGLSPPRFLLGAILLIAVALWAWLSYKSTSDQDWLARVIARADRFSSNRRKLLLVLLGLSLVVIASLALFYLWITARLIGLPYVLQVMLERIFPTLVWINLVVIQTLGVFSHPLQEELRSNLTRYPERFRKVLLTSSFMAAITHWVILALQWSALKIQYWFWNYRDRKAGFQELVFLGVFALVMVVLRVVLKNPERTRRNILMIMALGYAVQLGFGIAQGQGFESLRLKYLSSGNSTFSKNACDGVGVVESVRHYDEIYGSGFWEGTKPPGLQALYLLFGEGVKAVDAGIAGEACIKKLTTVEAYIFPLLAMIVLFLLILTGDLLGAERRITYLAAMLYITLPNFTQLPLFHDQFLYPLVFMSTVALIIYAAQRKSFWLSVGAGISIYIATFISFSLLPLAGFALVWLLVQWNSSQEPGSWRGILKSLGGILLGIALATLAIYTLLDYDPLRRYQAAMAAHRENKEFGGGLVQVWQAFVVNNLEYVILIGLPLAIMVIYQTMASLSKFVGEQTKQIDLFTLSLFITYLGLNAVGQTRGEVGRIWLFLAPAVCLVGAYGMSNVFKTKRLPVYLMVGMQLVTAILIFQFQDYGCKLCP